MKNIIQQIVGNVVEEILDLLRKDGITSVGKSNQRIQTIVNPAILEIVASVIEQMDQSLVDAVKERRSDRITVKQRDVPRELLTELGVLRYKRTYYQCDTHRLYLTDQLIGVAPYERVSRELCAKLVQYAAEGSMAAASRRAGVQVSRQTVDNRVLALSEVAVAATPCKQTPEELHVFADEDHVSLQNGRNAMVPLVTVTEGIDTSKKRHQTINAVHFEGYGISNDSFFEGISSFLNERYDMGKVKAVYVHADGGRWIDQAKDWFPHAIRVMDGYHLEKRFRQVAALNGASPYMQAIRRAVREDRFELFTSCCAKILDKQDDQGRKRLSEFVNFLQNNWDEAVIRARNEVCGSCTEPMVSHVLSSRLSRNPLAWSEHGLRQMAMLRVYTKNGGVVSADDVRVSRSKAQQKQDAAYRVTGFAKYRAYADKQIGEFLSHKLDWGMFEPSPPDSGKVDMIHLLRNSLGALQDSLSVS